ncbi:normal mucosa of esophagus-specific gene 1 protein-like [Saccoglossus kowalevskii]|uniref:Normal mucosa of esophagus-specific gene 1 protein-like n=1 Tax=Saccoglossus kowalevskii TaxID=10224 RepID=A0ABM0GL33_SACKO|nr:PREDICTED: normal mucosa of esophagus-specific gene 1 protein-like [Saccoglossus kowalevskii]
MPLSPAQFLKKHYELTPLVGIISFVGVLAVSAISYAAYQKTDVVFRKRANPFPYYEINPSSPQKLLTLKQIYKPDPKLEALRRDIGSPPSPYAKSE